MGREDAPGGDKLKHIATKAYSWLVDLVVCALFVHFGAVGEGSFKDF